MALSGHNTLTASNGLWVIKGLDIVRGANCNIYGATGGVYCR